MLRCRDRTDLPVTTTTPTLSRRRRWTYADYCRIPPDRKRHEIIDGRHFVGPAPDTYHQTLSRRLLYQLMTLVEFRGFGEVFHAPIDVHLGRGSVVQPDLVVLREANRSLVGDKKITGVPDLLVEILSPSRRRYDRQTKRGRYERAGVRECWIVDPEARCIEQYVLRDGKYGKPRLCSGSIRLRVLRGITLDLERVW